MTADVGSNIFDLLVVGGGINGAGVARDAAGRGLRVMLVEQDDLASHTSSASTKLIHGGLRYLEFMEFGLVRKALLEREVLLGIAPHIISPLRFIMPHEPSLRPAWMIRIGLFLYDHLAHRKKLEGSRGVDLRHHPAGVPLREGFRRGFEYSDGWVDDARLVVLNAIDAQEHGATILTRTRCIKITPTTDAGATEQPCWAATLQDDNGKQSVVTTRAVVNATGPWAAGFHDAATRGRSKHGLRLIKGSHIVVRRLFDHPYAYILQATDRRIVFAIPYEQDFTMIGTTDIEYHADPREVTIDADETAYLCEQSNRYFRTTLTPADVVSSWSGVRPLLEDESTDARAVTRDYALELEKTPAPLLSVFGGKITTYRVLAEEAVDLVTAAIDKKAHRWTDSRPLPGGDLASGIEPLERELSAMHPEISRKTVNRWARAYGSCALNIFSRSNELGSEIAPGLYEAELRYLYQTEWARTADDVLWRRSKLGLHIDAQSTQRVAEWLKTHGRPQ
jgi:glycerol-3-phosphate dehydrogenase